MYEDVNFQTTHWSVVHSAARPSDKSRRALHVLVTTYSTAIYAYARRRCDSIHDAQDATQGFFTELLERGYIGAADPQKGRFRSYLLGAFTNYLSRRRERDRAAIRGGNVAHLSINYETAEQHVSLHGSLSSEEIYDREWVNCLLDLVLNKLRKSYQERGDGQLFEALHPMLVPHASTHEDRGDVAQSLAMSDAAVRQAASRLRRRFRERFLQELAHTLGSAEDVDDEKAYLLDLMARH